MRNRLDRRDFRLLDKCERSQAVAPGHHPRSELLSFADDVLRGVEWQVRLQRVLSSTTWVNHD
jgi:hypothetical protein